MPVITSKLRTLSSKLKRKFPYLEICLWETSVLNEFMLHQAGQFLILIEVERDAIQSVFLFLRELKYSVFESPTKDTLEKYLPTGREVLIILPLVTEAPLIKLKGLYTASLEKILVDIFCDEDIFQAHQGAEMQTIFNEAISKYSLNQNRMLRYADRRGKKEKINSYLVSATDLRQQQTFPDNL